MKKKLFIGVDGGGSKSHLQLEDEQGNILATALSGMSSIRISVDRAWDSINKALKEAAEKAQLCLENYDLYAGFGLAGFEIKEKVRDFLSRPHPFKKLTLNSDGYCCCLGAHRGGNGAIIIVGTGIVGWQIIEGQATQTSGWGFAQGDEGSGAWIGLEAQRCLSRFLDGRGETSPLLDAIYKKFDNDLNTFAYWSDTAEATQFATLFPLVLEYMQQGDPIAVHLFKRAAAEMDIIYQALQRKAGEKADSIRYCLFGGVAPFLQKFVCEELQSKIIPRQHDATQGAIFMIKHELSQEI